MAGAAVAAQCLDPGQEFDAAKLGARGVSVVHSCHDRTLRSFQKGEFLPLLLYKGVVRRVTAIGLTGVAGRTVAQPPAPPAEPDGYDMVVRDLDVSQTVKGHSPQFFLASPQVVCHLYKLFGHSGYRRPSVLSALSFG